MTTTTGTCRLPVRFSMFQVGMPGQDDDPTQGRPPDLEQDVPVVKAMVETLLANGSKRKRPCSTHELLLRYLGHLDDKAEPLVPVVEPALPGDKPSSSREQDVGRSSAAPAITSEEPAKPPKGRFQVRLPPGDGRESRDTLVDQLHQPELQNVRSEHRLQEMLSSDAKIEDGIKDTIAKDTKPAADVVMTEETHDVPPSNSEQYPARSPVPSASSPQPPTNKEKARAGANDPPQFAAPENSPSKEAGNIVSWKSATLRDILRLVRNDLVDRAGGRSNDASAPDDSTSLNTRQEIWTISSFRSNKSVRSDADFDSIFDPVIPPDTPYDEDWCLPIESLLKPIKKNTYGPVVQENVQQFLAKANWAAQPSRGEEPNGIREPFSLEQEKDGETLWTAKRVPSHKVEYPVGMEPRPWSEDGDIPRVPAAGDPFLDSIEEGEAESSNRCTRPARPTRLSERSRERQYPGPTVLYSEAEYFGEWIDHMAGDTRHRVYVKQLSTQSPTPDYYRRRGQNVGEPSGHASATQSEVLPESQPPIHKDCVICCNSTLLTDFPQYMHMQEHEICRYCIAKYLTIKIFKEGTVTLACPAERCSHTLEYAEIKESCSAASFTRYDDLLSRKAVEEDPNFRWCTNRECSAGQIVDNGGTNNALLDFNSPACGFKSCFQCRTPSHPDLTCMQNWTHLGNQYFAADEKSGVWLKSYTKPCYCGRWIQKMDGCDHVKCPPRPTGCGEEWCWMCGAKYEEIRRVGNTAHQLDCPHWA